MWQEAVLKTFHASMPKNMRQQTNKDKDADRQKNANMTDLKHKLFFAKLAKSQNKTKTNRSHFKT
jgi:hypothetical protein